jgi:hypothetical protein
MPLDGDVVLFEELADGKVSVDDGYVYRVRMKLLKLPNELVWFIEALLSKVSIEEGTQSVRGVHGKSKGRRRELP